MHKLVGLLGVCALAAALAAPASAGKPVRITESDAQSHTSHACGSFDVLVEVEGRVKLLLFSDEDGNLARVIATFPTEKVTLTNKSTGASIRLSISGPSHVDFAGNAVRWVGPWILDINPETLDEGGLWLSKGKFAFSVDAEGYPYDASFQGHVVDLCAELAA